MHKHTSDSQLKVDGKMTSKGADRVGMLQGIALLIFAISALVVSISFILYAVR